MKSLIHLFFWMILLLSCGSSDSFDTSKLNSTSNVSVTNAHQLRSEFQKLCDNLPTVKLPFSIYCEQCCKHPELSLEQAKINEFLPEGSSFVGVIEISEDYVSLLTSYPADWIIPAVIVLDPDGKLIDEEVFLGGYCGSDYGYMGKQYFFIKSRTELLEIDTSYHLSYVDETYDIKDTTKIEIKNELFRIDKNGITKSE